MYNKFKCKIIYNKQLHLLFSNKDITVLKILQRQIQNAKELTGLRNLYLPPKKLENLQAKRLMNKI